MLAPFAQNWRTSLLPFSLALTNTVNTGVSFDTPSGAIANSKFWASRGFRGYGPVMQYRGAGMDGLRGCKCQCGGMSGLTMDGSGLLGTGIFGTGVNLFDFSTWTPAEVITAGLMAYMAYAFLFTTKTHAAAVRGKVSRVRKAITS